MGPFEASPLRHTVQNFSNLVRLHATKCHLHAQMSLPASESDECRCMLQRDTAELIRETKVARATLVVKSMERAHEMSMGVKKGRQSTTSARNLADSDARPDSSERCNRFECGSHHISCCCKPAGSATKTREKLHNVPLNLRRGASFGCVWESCPLPISEPNEVPPRALRRGCR